MRPSTIDCYYWTVIVDTLGPMGLHIFQSSNLNRLLANFTGIVRKVPGIFQNWTFLLCLMSSLGHLKLFEIKRDLYNI